MRQERLELNFQPLASRAPAKLSPHPPRKPSFSVIFGLSELAIRRPGVQNSRDFPGASARRLNGTFAMMANRALIAAALLACLAAGPARAENCGPDLLGVSRTIAVGGAPQLGLKTYPRTLDLKDHEVVLTFDDGPANTTPAVLAALDAQCAKATFFLIGRNAAARPDLVRREIAAGHTVAHHSFSHAAVSLAGLPLEAALADIDRGVAAVDRAAGGPTSKFFRFPGFGDSPALLEALASKNMPTFGTDLWASDWNPMTPQAELELVMGRLRHAGGGILLLHDIHKQTADMLPALPARLKAENFHLVHLVPGDAPPAMRPAPPGWKSDTAAYFVHSGNLRAAEGAKAAHRGESERDGPAKQDRKDAPVSTLPAPETPTISGAESPSGASPTGSAPTQPE
jgi:peptidoglycan/xylan/chitin deacetylase (PgdA/CDA1 family)